MILLLKRILNLLGLIAAAYSSADSALTSLTTGDRNTMLGHGALSTNTTADNNTAVGRNALRYLATGGGRNVAIGVNALTANSNFEENTAVGTYALENVTGNVNIGLGVGAGRNITSGSGNVIIGEVEAPSATGDRQLVIAGHDGTTRTTWISGDSSGNLTTVGDVTLANDKKVIFGDAGEHIAGNGTDLTIASSGAINIDAVSGSVNYSANGTGYLSLINSAGSTWIRNYGQDKDILFIGNDGGSSITALTLDMSEAGNATFNGTIEAANFKQGGTNFSESILIGQSTTGTLNNASGNVGIGDDVFSSITTGQNNVVMGNNAGTSIVSGYRSVIIGADAGINMVAAPYNTVVGAFAGKTISSGEFNTFIGGKAGEAVSSGAGNVMIGFGAAPPSVTGDHQLQISGNNNTGNAVNWIAGDSSGLVTMSGGISTPTITGLTSLTTENINIDNNSITAVASNIEQVSYTSVTNNLILNSNIFSTSTWSNTGQTLSQNSAVAPDGTTTGNKFTAASTVSGGNGYGSQLTGPLPESGVEYTYSMHVKQGSVNDVGHSLTLQGSGGSDSWSEYKPLTGWVQSNNVNQNNNGWARYSYTFTTGAAGSYRVGFSPPYNGGNYSRFWGAQLEKGSSPTRLIYKYSNKYFNRNN